MPKGFSDHEKEVIKNKLLEEGGRLFSVFGLKKTSIDELAAAAGISKGAFYIFYESKEELFMDVAEVAEHRFREEMLIEVDKPAPTPRMRLFNTFKKAFLLSKTLPILQQFTGTDFDVLSRRMPENKLAEHMGQDKIFMSELMARCITVGIPIRAKVDDIMGLMYMLFLMVLHQNDMGPHQLDRPIDFMLELVTAFCLGEVEMQAVTAMVPLTGNDEGKTE
jgi:AcrR family transcriptional regulator